LNILSRKSGEKKAAAAAAHQVEANRRETAEPGV
jgi:hypothetical protein